MQIRYWIPGAIFLGTVAMLAVWLTNYSGTKPRNKLPEPKSLDAYREQFRRPDGSLPADPELLQILQAKGVPYQETCPEGMNCSSGGPAAVSAIPEPDFSAARIAAARRDELRVSIAATLGGQLDAMRRINPELRLERIAVDSGMKLQLYFNKQFEQIADDETQLNEFSEGLHSLGVAGLRGSVIYIAGERLGLYLQKKDAERNRNARNQLPGPSGENRR